MNEELHLRALQHQDEARPQTSATWHDSFHLDMSSLNEVLLFHATNSNNITKRIHWLPTRPRSKAIAMVGSKQHTYPE